MAKTGNMRWVAWTTICMGAAVACSGKAESTASGDGDTGGTPGDGDAGGTPGDGDGDAGGTRGDGDTGGTPGDGDTGGTPGNGDTGGAPGDGDGDAGGLGGAGGANSATDLPCDVFESAGHPCVAAHSTIRLLRQVYEGPLYELSNLANEKLNIGATDAGTADAALHDEFCGTGTCTITTIYDQSGQENHLEPSPPGSAKPTAGLPAGASVLPTTIHGSEAYGILIRPTWGYRAGCYGCTKEFGSGIPVEDEPETIYMVTSNQDLIDGCCFSYGNASRTANNDGNGTAEAVSFGMGVIWGTGTGEGPWVMANLENGLFPGWENGGFNYISTNTPLDHVFVTAMLVGDTADKNAGQGRFALYGGDAQGGTLTTMYDGIRPERVGYVPMQKQGSVILGIGSDNSNGGGGRFYEGAIVTGAASKETLDSVQAGIAAAGYGE